MRRSCLAGLALSFISTLALADEPGSHTAPPAGTDPAPLEVIVVTGVQPGPGLWKVSKDDHVMWILGEVSPYPRKTQWNSKDFDRLLQGSQELIIDFSGYWTMDPSDSAAYDREEKLPDELTLKDSLSPELYARVENLAKVFGAKDLENLYPFAVTNRLVSSAMKTLDLTGFSARFAADALGKKRRVKTTYFSAPEPPFKVRLQNWQHPSNVICLERLANAIKDGGNGVKRLANAWSIGDIDALRHLVAPFSFSRDGFRADECAAAMRGGDQAAREYNAKRKEAWLVEAERALWYNKRTMAVVLMSEIFAPDGYLAGLRAKGYEIEEPK